MYDLYSGSIYRVGFGIAVCAREHVCVCVRERERKEMVSVCVCVCVCCLKSIHVYCWPWLSGLFESSSYWFYLGRNQSRVNWVWHLIAIKCDVREAPRTWCGSDHPEGEIKRPSLVQFCFSPNCFGPGRDLRQVGGCSSLGDCLFRRNVKITFSDNNNNNVVQQGQSWRVLSCI